MTRALTARISFLRTIVLSGLDRRVSKKKLNLLKLPASQVA